MQKICKVEFLYPIRLPTCQIQGEEKMDRPRL